MRIAAVLLLLAVSSPAYADDDEYLGAQLDPLTQAIYGSLARQYIGGGLRVNASAGVASDLDVPIAGTAAADIGYDLPLCRVFGVGGSGMVGYGDGERLGSWSASSTACIPLPWDTMMFTLTHGQNVRSPLFAREETVRARESVWRGDLYIHGFGFALDRDRFDFAVVHTGLELVDGRGVPGSTTLTVAMGVAKWIKLGGGVLGDRTLTLFDIEVEAASSHTGSRSGNQMVMAPIRVENVHLGSRLALSGAVGVVGGDAGSDSAPDTRPGIFRAYGDAAAEMDLGVAIAGLRGTRTSHALFDGQIVLDDRVSATLRTERKRWSGRAEGFLARQEVVRDTPGATVGTGGGVLEASYKLDDTLTATLRTEAGRTLTAASAMDPVSAEWDVRATVGLSASYSGLFR